LKKWVLIGLALLVAVLIVAGVRFFATTPGKIDRSQNKIEPIPLSITPAAQALQSTMWPTCMPTVCCGSATC
jgi:membrane dipeptidase